MSEKLCSAVGIFRTHEDAESAVKETTRKFTTRFQYIENHYRANGKDIHNATLEELDAVWDQAKEI